MMKCHDFGEGRPVRSVRARRRRPRVIAVLGVAVPFAACAGDSDVTEVSQGQALYETNCMMCHGERALGDGPMAASLPVQPPALIEHLGHHSRAELLRLVTTGIPPAMPPAPVSQDELNLIVDYLWTLVPADQVEALRAMQQRMEDMGDMPGMQGMDHDNMPGMTNGAGMPNMPMDSTQGAMPPM